MKKHRIPIRHSLILPQDTPDSGMWIHFYAESKGLHIRDFRRLLLGRPEEKTYTKHAYWNSHYVERVFGQ